MRMSTEDDYQAEARALLRNVGVKATAAGAAALMAGRNLEDAAMATGIAGLASLVTDSTRLLNARRVVHWVRLLFGFAKPGESADDVTQRFHAALLDESAQTAIRDALRALENVIDPSVLPALGALTREYTEGSRRVDDFFRGVARTLQELSADEFVSLQVLTTAIAAHPRAAPHLDLNVMPPHDGTGEQIAFLKEGCSSGEPGAWEYIPGVANPRRLVHLLLTNGIAAYSDTIGPGASMTVAKMKAARIAKLISVPQP